MSPRGVTIDDLVVGIHQLGRQVGTHVEHTWTAPAPEGWGLEHIAVPAGAPLDIEAVFETVGDGVLVSGEVSYPLDGRCARCLGPVETAATSAFQELFVYDMPVAGEDDEVEVSPIVAERVDLGPVVHDAIILDLPSTPLCEDNCAGLCVQCGVDLNEQPDHVCAPLVDERWAGLSAWRESAQ
ncbi:MAG: DUF177 domain-containing protein [Propionibacteriaceae bacterium]|jgi:uncharacterized protein|nr:DUF177 domain-containing protein [Propionibacteriaceae bacterium]